MRARRAPPQPPEPPEPPEAAPVERPGLMRKYRELLTKHTALVRKLEERTTLHVSTFKLSSWALETSESALAVARTGRVILANSRWHALCRVKGPWRLLGPHGPTGPEHVSLRELTLAEAEGVLSQVEEGARLTRYRRSHADVPRVLELRTERVAGPVGGEVLLLAQDITVQVEAEEELVRARAVGVERAQIRALGELAAGIAHDLRNTLNAMRLRLEMLQRDTVIAENSQRHLDALTHIVSDASGRVGRLQDFTRQKPTGGVEHVQLVEVVRDAVDIARGGIEHRAQRTSAPLVLELALPDALPRVAGSAMELRYVVINLLINARDAMPHGGTIRVSAGHRAKTVWLKVEDEGTGIPEEHLPNLFQPFFTTKGDKGTGLGLSMAHGVVTRAGGKLSAANRSKGGAVFHITFPALKPPARRKAGAR
ncbi:HAMP domain-containing histidine kinase [Corallococcus macrosporus]|uniref:histidine kinase n=1 Tax=Corallococcus macrosporus TaxID=35 RepID=A0ABS3DD86_9BACT|nr:HAMP domain-containing sensor histidine kinase [Corallococcus macrosporus]MBN8229578.1 HAMP domain-containing histidine kinase [Corallococcus macrosporus]